MFKKCIIHLILLAFFFTSIGPFPDVSAQTIIDLPAPGMIINKSNSFQPLQLKGILINVKNPLRFDFLIDKGDTGLYGQSLKDEIIRSAKYFLTCLTVPENDLWVNLSPYEKDHIVPGNFGITLMGKNLLEQDYLLKQMMASLSYPENDLGKRFWQRVYRKSYELYGTTSIPINTFNKVWIIPKSAQVYVQGNAAFVVNSKLDVMLEADYKAFVHQGFSQKGGAYSQIFRDVILPELRQEVNEGKNFAVVRQVYNAMILATWYKRHLKDSLLGRMYVGKNEVGGIDIADKNAKEKIFRQYLQAYKKCVYNYIKEDYDPATKQTVPRKYASGGMYFVGFGGPDSVYEEVSNTRGMGIGHDLAMATVNVAASNGDGQIISFPDIREITHTHPFDLKVRNVPAGMSSSKSSSDQAMAVPRFLRPLILPFALAVGGILMTSSMAFATATIPSSISFTAQDNLLNITEELSKQIIPDAVESGFQNYDTKTDQHGIPLADAIKYSKSETEAQVKLNTALQNAHQKKADATEKGTVRLYLEGGAEANPVLLYLGLGLEIRTPALTHPTKAHDARQKPIDDALAKSAQDIKVRGNTFDIIASVKKYASINDHLKRLESISLPGMDDEIAQANEEKRHQLAFITASLVIPFNDLPAGSNIVITDAWMDMGHVEALVKEQGINDQTQARLAGLTLQGSVENVRGNLEINERSKLQKAIPSHLTIHINPTNGSMGGGVVGWLIGFVTPEWKVYPQFDAQGQAGKVQEATAVWQDARLTMYRQLKQTLLGLRTDQIDLKAAQEAWDNRGDKEDQVKLTEMSAQIREFEDKVTAGQLTAMNMGIGAALVENAGTSTPEDLTSDAQELVQEAFRQGVVDMRAQAQEWQGKLEANHKDKKNVPVILAVVDGIETSMGLPLKDEDTKGMPAIDATAGAKVSGSSFSIGLPSPIVSYTSGTSSNSPDAPTFINGVNEGGVINPVFRKGGTQESKDLQTEMNFAQEQFSMAQHGEGEGPKEFRQAIYGYLTFSISQKIVATGQGFAFTQMFAYYRSTTSYDNYSVFSLTSFDPMHLVMKGISKLKHHTVQEEASVITAKALTEELKIQAMDDMFAARADPAKGSHWQAWDMFINGQNPFISMTDSKGNACGEFNELLQGLREELKPLWENGPVPGSEPLEIRLMRLHLETAKKLRSYGPAVAAYWTAPVVVRVGANTGAMYWEGFRGGVTIDWADKKRAMQDVDMQITQLEDDVGRKTAEWQRNQAAVEAEFEAKRALEDVLTNQPEESPLTIQAPEGRWLDIANAVAAQQPIRKELAKVNKQGKDPRTIAINILASVQVHPAVAEEVLGGISKDLIDWVHRARVEEVNAWISQLQHQADVDGITAARRVMDLFAQERFAMGASQKADAEFKQAFAEWQATKQGHAKMESAQRKFLFTRIQLETSSRRLSLAFSVLSDQEQRTYGIDHVLLETAPMPKVDLLAQNQVDLTVRNTPTTIIPSAVEQQPVPHTLTVTLQHHVKAAVPVVKNKPYLYDNVFTLTIPSVTNNHPTGSPPPPPPPPKDKNLEILKYIKTTWPWYAGVAVFGFGIGGLWFSRAKLRKRHSTPKVQWSEPSGLVVHSSSQPLVMSPEEKDLLPGLKDQLEALQKEDDHDQAMSSRILARTALVLPLVNAAYSTTNIWIHEIAHVIAIAILYPMPRYWKKSFSLSNLGGNLNSTQWKEYFLSRLLGRNYQGENPYVSFPAGGWRDWAISKLGIAGTILANTAVFAAAFGATLNHIWLIPLLGIVGVNGLSAIREAWVSDIRGSLQDRENGERLYPCGISVHSRFGKRTVLADQGDDTFLNRIADMMYVESDRGRHEVGLLIMRLLKTGKVSVIVEKALEGKRGPGSDSIKQVLGGMKKSLPAITEDGPDEYMLDTVIGHNRLASGGEVETPAAHPHIGQEHEKILWSLHDGILVEGKSMQPELDVEIARPQDFEEGNGQEKAVANKINTGAAHNGDGDAYQPLAADGFIDNLDELRSLAVQLVHFQGKLPPGDSPVIPLIIQFHLTQGNADASVRFAHVRVHHKTVDELREDLLTENEETVAGEVFNRGIRRFGAVLSRPGLKDPEKTISDLYVSEKMAEDNPNDGQIQFQYDALKNLRKYLTGEFKKEAAAGNLPEKITRHWHGPDADKVIEDFVELSVYKFFTGDRDIACKEFEEQSKGTYALAVKVSTELNGLTLLSRRLGMVWGYNLEKGYLDASSDPYALLRKYKNGDQLNALMFLDPRGKGEIGNYHVSKVTGDLHVNIFSLERNKYLTREEIYAREYLLSKDNPYYQPLHQYQNEKRRMVEDLDQITPGIAKLVQGFEREQGFNYQSGREVFKNLMALWINGMINGKLFKGGEYQNIFLKTRQMVNDLNEQCSSSGNCSEEYKEFLDTEMSATEENSVLMALVGRWLSNDALALASLRINEEISQEQLDGLISKAIQNRSDYIVKLLTINNLGQIYKYWVQERQHPFSGKEKIGMLFAGDENSDNGPRASEDAWNALLPNLPKRFVSSHELLEYQSLPFDITSPAVTILTSKAGGNFNTMQALDVMVNAVGEDHVWGVTGRPDSPLSVALGQGLRPESPFIGHVFYTGDHYRAQTQAASESLTSALHNLLPIFVALQFEKYCPGQHPFGLNLSSAKIAYLKKLMQEMMLKDAKRITGRDEDGYRVLTPAYKALDKRGKYLASRLWETPLVNLLYRFFVYLIFLGGPFILSSLQLCHIIPGPALHSWSGFLTTTADYLLTMFIPLGLTLIYRKLTGYNPWVRLGPPANINVVGLKSYPDVQKMLLRVIFSRSYATWSSQVESETYEQAIANIGLSQNRGTWIFGHIGGSSEIQRKSKGALKQLKVTRTGIFGTKYLRTGAISFTTSRGPFQDMDKIVSDDNVDIGGTQFSPPNDDDMIRVYNAYDAWGANLAFKVEASAMADTLTFRGRAWDPSRKVNNALSLTTESGQPSPEIMPMRDQAQVSAPVTRDGGINMDSRLMKLDITGDTQNRIGNDGNTIVMPVIRGVVPQVSGIITVTPDMLKAILGAGYLN